jgi:hypothetical protein
LAGMSIMTRGGVIGGAGAANDAIFAASWDRTPGCEWAARCGWCAASFPNAPPMETLGRGCDGPTSRHEPTSRREKFGRTCVLE